MNKTWVGLGVAAALGAVVFGVGCWGFVAMRRSQHKEAQRRELIATLQRQAMDAAGNKDYGLAIKRLDEALAALPPGSLDKSEFLLRRGDYCMCMGAYDAAVADYTQAIGLEPRSARLYACRARAYRLAGQKNAASADWREAVRLDPALRDDPEAKLY